MAGAPRIEIFEKCLRPARRPVGLAVGSRGGAHRGAALAARGLVRVGADFARRFPDGDASSTEAFASLARAGTALLQELERAVVASFDLSNPPRPRWR